MKNYVSHPAFIYSADSVNHFVFPFSGLMCGATAGYKQRACCARLRRCCDFLKGLPLHLPSEHKLERFLTGLASNHFIASTHSQAVIPDSPNLPRVGGKPKRIRIRIRIRRGTKGAYRASSIGSRSVDFLRAEGWGWRSSGALCCARQQFVESSAKGCGGPFGPLIRVRQSLTLPRVGGELKRIRIRITIRRGTKGEDTFEMSLFGRGCGK